MKRRDSYESVADCTTIEVAGMPDVAAHMGLVKRVASHFRSRLPAAIEPSDLIQAGMVGVIEALAADAKLTGLGQIDHVARSRNGEGLIAVQGNDPWAPDAKRAFLDVSQATSQTLEQSTQMADSKKQDSVATPQPTAPERAVATEQSNPVLIADEPQRSSGVRLA